jgi:hypothetical protein
MRRDARAVDQERKQGHRFSGRMSALPVVRSVERAGLCRCPAGRRCRDHDDDRGNDDHDRGAHDEHDASAQHDYDDGAAAFDYDDGAAAHDYDHGAAADDDDHDGAGCGGCEARWFCAGLARDVLGAGFAGLRVDLRGRTARAPVTSC